MGAVAQAGGSATDKGFILPIALPVVAAKARTRWHVKDAQGRYIAECWYPETAAAVVAALNAATAKDEPPMLSQTCARCAKRYAVTRPRAQVDGLCPACHNRERVARNRQHRIDNGLCLRCGQPAESERSKCAVCRKADAERQHSRRKRKRGDAVPTA